MICRNGCEQGSSDPAMPVRKRNEPVQMQGRGGRLPAVILRTVSVRRPSRQEPPAENAHHRHIS